MDCRSILRLLALGGCLAGFCADARAQQAVIEPLPPVNPPPASAETISPTESPADASLQMLAVPEPVIDPPKLWSGSFDLGLNGSEGNSQVFNMRFNLLAERKDDDNKLSLKLNYVDSATSDVQTANRLFFDGRDEVLFEDSPWTLYVHETTEYDEFKAFNVRLTADAGVGYQLIKDDLTSLVGRIGPGVSREIGGPDDDYVPELVMGLALERQLSKLQKLVMSVDYFPEITDFANYRVNSQASWQIVIDEANNLSLKLSAVDRYDSTPGGKRPNDLDYAATLLWSY